MALEIHCNGFGIFSIGNMNPLNKRVGNNIPISEISMATCCDSVLTDINNPSDKQVMINKVLSANSKSTLPLIGNFNTKTLSNNIVVTFTNESAR